MPEYQISYDEVIINKTEEIQGAQEFGFWRIIRGLFIDGPELADEINAAIEEAYAES